MGSKTQYIGETSRSLYERMTEHARDCQNLEVESHMASHILEYHPEKAQDLEAVKTIA